MPRQKKPQAVPVSGAQTMFEQMRAEMLAEVKQEMLAELRGELHAVTTAPAKPAPGELLEDGAPRGKRGPVRGANSRYVEPGVRRTTQRMVKPEAAETKIWSSFMDPTIINAFKACAKSHGMTYRAAGEQALTEWVERKGGKVPR